MRHPVAIVPAIALLALAPGASFALPLPSPPLQVKPAAGKDAKEKKKEGKEEKGEKDALADYKKAVQLAQKEQWADALALFAQAHEKGAPSVVHYNMGRCLEKLGKIEEAAAQYTLYLDAPDATDVNDVVAKIDELRATPSAVTIDSVPAGATVVEKAAGVETVKGTTPLTIELAAGEHLLVVGKAGFQEAALTASAGFGRKIALKAELAPAKAVPPGGGGEGDGGKKKGKKPGKAGPVGLALEAGGACSLHPYRDVDLSANGGFLVDVHKVLGGKGKKVSWAAGLALGGMFYSMAARDGGSYRSLFVDVLATARARVPLSKRVTLTVGVPVGFSFLAMLDDVPATADLPLVGGRIEGGSIPFFTTGLEGALRVNVVSGFHVVIRPVGVTLMVPLKKLYGSNKVLPRIDFALLLGWDL